MVTWMVIHDHISWMSREGPHASMPAITLHVIERWWWGGYLHPRQEAASPSPQPVPLHRVTDPPRLYLCTAACCPLQPRLARKTCRLQAVAEVGRRQAAAAEVRVNQVVSRKA